MSGTSKKATAAQFRRVKIFLTDVDGVLTDGGVYVGKGGEFKRFNILDGMGLRLLKHVGIPVGWVSNRKSVATTARAKELKVDYLWQKSLPKVAAVEAILKKAKLTWGDACFLSDDLNDLNVLRRVGLPIAVANAVAEVKNVAHYTTNACGGDGAVREVCDRIIKSQGLWNGLVRKLSGLDE
jgi:3-deoxy-D-manno-octulosonate 8-phosphate phosphatase (KDO 8-P phosphatase)